MTTRCLPLDSSKIVSQIVPSWCERNDWSEIPVDSGWGDWGEKQQQLHEAMSMQLLLSQHWGRNLSCISWVDVFSCDEGAATGIRNHAEHESSQVEVAQASQQAAAGRLDTNMDRILHWIQDRHDQEAQLNAWIDHYSTPFSPINHAAAAAAAP